MKRLLLLACLLAAGCTALRLQTVMDRRQQGESFASIRMTNTAFFGPPKADTGYLFYTEKAPHGAEPVLWGYEYRNGERRKAFGGGPDSAKIGLAIQNVGLEPFDFAAEVSAVTARFEREAQVRGESYMPPIVLDGAEFEITIRTSKGEFVLKQWNPGPTIDAFAPHSEKLAKLKAVLDILARFSGRARFDI